MELTHFPSDTDPVTISNHLREHGYAIVDDVVADDTMNQLADEAAPFIEASATGRDTYDGIFTRRTGMLVARCPAARSLVMHPTVVGTVHAFLSHVTAVQLHCTQLITIAPGETDQKLHRDQMAFDFFPFPVDYHAQCNTMWALTDFTAANGATRIVPGSSAATDEEAARMPSGQATMRRGSVLFYDGKVLHGGAGNASDSERIGVNLTYSIGWVRQEENQFLAVPPDVARTLDDDLLRMLGYQQGAFALGYVGDQVDPLAFLRGVGAKTKLIHEIEQKTDGHRAFVTDLG